MKKIWFNGILFMIILLFIILTLFVIKDIKSNKIIQENKTEVGVVFSEENGFSALTSTSFPKPEGKILRIFEG
jgi:hypothetical protein